ncbi:3032_t:CDS:2 [Gigaspora margarita]|uniref:3032_t:CDS:1 n=1 Tax=Gigaspora margarita TaxID=4874 RepID=A0ABN7URD9_GIGMA|nr:3032_t:CDS:2 [Gigaspora margarita]
MDDDELACFLADRAKNPDGGIMRTFIINFVLLNLVIEMEKLDDKTGELCFLDVYASFDPLNTSISLLYTSCMAGALPSGIFSTFDEAEVATENAINLLKTILPANAFYGYGPQLGP